MTTTSYIPPGFLKLRDAVDRIGQHRYGTAWTDPKRPSDRLEAAVDQLRGLLALGKVNAVAVAENGKVFPVESSVWLAGNGRQVFDTELLPVGNLRESLAARNHGTLRRQILVFENQLLALLKEEAEGNDTTQRQGTIATEKKCQKWLSEDGFSFVAVLPERFGVGSKAFNRAWANAITESDNIEWSRPGRKS